MNKKEAAKEFLTLIASGKIREGYEKYTASNFCHHNAYFKGDKQSLMVAMEESDQNFPNKVFEIQRVIHEGDLVAIHSKVELNPDIIVSAVHICRFEGDLIAEFWDIGQVVQPDCPNENGMF